MDQITVTAPAKLNLRLRVVGRRSDGYHLLQMWNVLISLQDKLLLKRQVNTRVELIQHGGPEIKTEDNIVWRATTVFLKTFSLAAGMRIELEKKIPSGAGLGGGSSDAAATLRGLMRLFDVQDLGRVRALAATLGADVPYFFDQFSGALVEGIGERVTALSLDYLQGVPCVVLMPEQGLVTSEMYSDLRQDPLPEVSPVDPPAEYNLLLAGLVNDFEPYAIRRNSQVRQCLANLNSSANLVCGLTGSGAAMFVIPRDPKCSALQLQQLVEQLLLDQAVARIPVSFLI